MGSVNGSAAAPGSVMAFGSMGRIVFILYSDIYEEVHRRKFVTGAIYVAVHSGRLVSFGQRRAARVRAGLAGSVAGATVRLFGGDCGVRGPLEDVKMDIASFVRSSRPRRVDLLHSRGQLVRGRRLSGALSELGGQFNGCTIHPTILLSSGRLSSFGPGRSRAVRPIKCL